MRSLFLVRKTRSVWPTSRPHARSSARVVTIQHVWLFLREFEVHATFALCVKGERFRLRASPSSEENFWSVQTVLEGRIFFSFLGALLWFFFISLARKREKIRLFDIFFSLFQKKNLKRELFSSVESGFWRRRKLLWWVCSRARERESLHFRGIFSLSLFLLFIKVLTHLISSSLTLSQAATNCRRWCRRDHALQLRPGARRNHGSHGPKRRPERRGAKVCPTVRSGRQTSCLRREGR